MTAVGYLPESRMWNPVEQPYRVLLYFSTPAPGLCGWHARVVGPFATESEAFAALAKPFLGRVYEGRVYVAVSPETWPVGGSWKQIARRVRKGKVIRTRQRNASETAP